MEKRHVERCQACSGPTGACSTNTPTMTGPRPTKPPISSASSIPISAETPSLSATPSPTVIVPAEGPLPESFTSDTDCSSTPCPGGGSATCKPVGIGQSSGYVLSFRDYNLAGLMFFVGNVDAEVYSGTLKNGGQEIIQHFMRSRVQSQTCTSAFQPCCLC